MKLWAMVLLLAGSAQSGSDPIEESARRLEEQLIAPCCWRQPLSMHDSEPARVMKEEIRGMLASGESEEQILATYEGRYGIQILAEPPAVGFHRVLSILPIVVLSAGAALLSFVLFRWRGRARATEEAPRAISPDRLEQIERELAGS